jgi:hypothetical protein
MKTFLLSQAKHQYAAKHITRGNLLLAIYETSIPDLDQIAAKKDACIVLVCAALSQVSIGLAILIIKSILGLS